MASTLAFQKSYDFYKNLYINLRKVPKRDRYTWGERCEVLALDLVQTFARAEFLPKGQKRLLLIHASETTDMLKIYLRLGIDLHIIDMKTLVARQGNLQEIGKMLGGWIKDIS